MDPIGELVDLMVNPTDNLHKIIKLGEQFEKSLGRGHAASGSEAIVAALFLAYYVSGDLQSSRYLWKRLPDTFRSARFIREIWRICQERIRRNFPHLLNAFDKIS